VIHEFVDRFMAQKDALKERYTTNPPGSYDALVKDVVEIVLALLDEITRLRAVASKADALTQIGHGLRLDEPVNVGSLKWADSAFEALREFARVALGEKP
jgi:hypothetical protein